MIRAAGTPQPRRRSQSLGVTQVSGFVAEPMGSARRIAKARASHHEPGHARQADSPAMGECDAHPAANSRRWARQQKAIGTGRAGRDHSQGDQRQQGSCHRQHGLLARKEQGQGEERIEEHLVIQRQPECRRGGDSHHQTDPPARRGRKRECRSTENPAGSLPRQIRARAADTRSPEASRAARCG